MSNIPPMPQTPVRDEPSAFSTRGAKLSIGLSTVLALTLIAGGYAVANSRTAAESEEALQVVSLAEQLDSKPPPKYGSFGVVEDETSICVKHTAGRAKTTACSSQDQDEPAISTVKDFRSGEGSLLVLDVRRRLDHLRIHVDGEAATFHSSDGGLTIQATGSEIPSLVEVFDSEGGVLATTQPASDLAQHGESVVAEQHEVHDHD